MTDWIENAFNCNPMLFCGIYAALSTGVIVPYLTVFMPLPPAFVPAPIAAMSEHLWIVTLVVGLSSSIVMLKRGWRYRQFRRETKRGRVEICADEDANAFSLNRDPAGRVLLNILSCGEYVSWDINLVSISYSRGRSTVLSYRVSEFQSIAFMVRANNPQFLVNLFRVINFQTKSFSNNRPISDSGRYSGSPLEPAETRLFRVGCEFVKARVSAFENDGLSKQELNRHIREVCIQSLEVITQTRTRHGLPKEYRIIQRNYAKFLVANAPLNRDVGTVQNWLSTKRSFTRETTAFIEEYINRLS